MRNQNRITTIQKCAWVYAAMFFAIVAMGHISFFNDTSGMLLGGFKIDPVDDVLHGASGLWAAYAAWKSAKSSRFYFRAFGSFYTADAFLGFLTGFAFTDFITGNWDANAGYSFFDFAHNLAVNLPHFVIGPFALLIGFKLYKSLEKA